MSFLTKFADELKSRNIEVLSPIHVNGGGKIGLYGTHQFSCTHENLINEMVDRCLEVSPNKLQFVELALPKHVDQALLLIRENILLRYIKMNDAYTAEPIERWDALIQVT